MVNIEFNCFGTDKLKIAFKCCKCNSEIIEEISDIPEPDYSADTDSDSQVSFDDNFFCPNCNKEYMYEIYCGMYSGGNLSIEGISNDTEISLVEIPDTYIEAIQDNEEPFETFKSQMKCLSDLMDISYNNYVIEQTVNKLVYANIVTCMETYLSDSLINLLSTDEKILREFVENNDDYKKLQFNLSDIFKKYESLSFIIRDKLYNFTFHKLQDVNKLFKSISIIFPDFTDIHDDIVIKRHDIVHRNGKDKNGNEIIISKNDVKNVYQRIYEFIEKIEKQIKAKE